MRLYKMELYKLCHRKIFIIGFLTMAVVLFIDYGELRGMLAHIDEIEYEYSQVGWTLFDVDYSVTMMVLGVVLLCIISTVFSHEEQTRMKPVLLTTQKGPDKDALAKIAAAYTVSIGFWLITTLILLLLHITVSGLSALKLTAADILWHTSTAFGVLAQPLWLYLLEVILFSFLAVLELCAIILAVSAKCRSNFHSLCVSILFCIFVPIFAVYLLRSTFQCLMFSAPFFLVYPDILVEISSLTPDYHGEAEMILFVATLGCIVTILCIIKAYRRHRKPYT